MPAETAPLDFAAIPATLRASEDMPSDTIYLPADLADRLLQRQGWQLEPCRGGNAYVMPGRTLRADGGKFGVDYLWDREEAVTYAIVAEVQR